MSEVGDRPTTITDEFFMVELDALCVLLTASLVVLAVKLAFLVCVVWSDWETRSRLLSAVGLGAGIGLTNILFIKFIVTP